MRHGHAGMAADDRSRPLSTEGRAAVRRVARHAAAAGLRVAEIRQSGLVRARETAEILAEHLAPPRGVREAPGLRPDDDPALARAELDLAPEPLLLVGHFPHLGRLVSLLVQDAAAGAVPAMPPGTLVALARHGRRWTVEWVVTPDLAPGE